MLTLTNQQARRFLLTHQYLWPPRALESKSGILDYIRHVRCIQFDPLNIVGQNPDLVLQARVSNYRPSMLQDLLYKDRQLLDGWDKNMSIYPVEDWPYFQRRRQAALHRLGDPSQPATSILSQVRQEIEARGPLSSIDLDFDQTVDWSWAPTRIARAALESMYFWGELVIHHRIHTRKVYDFAARHMAQELLSAPDPNTTEEQFHDWYVLRRLGSVGLLWNRAGDAWLGMPDIKSRERGSALARLLAQGKVQEVQVEGIKPLFYMRSEDKRVLDAPSGIEDPPPRATILAPLDNLIWDRRLVQALFGFHYLWEVYKPVPERRYGYYVLPVLYGDRFVARFEPGRDKESGALIIKNWWWEAGVAPSERMRQELVNCFAQFLMYLDTDILEIDTKATEQAGLQWLTAGIIQK